MHTSPQILVQSKEFYISLNIRTSHRTHGARSVCPYGSLVWLGQGSLAGALGLHLYLRQKSCLLCLLPQRGFIVVLLNLLFFNLEASRQLR